MELKGVLRNLKTYLIVEIEKNQGYHFEDTLFYGTGKIMDNDKSYK